MACALCGRSQWLSSGYFSNKQSTWWLFYHLEPQKTLECDLISWLGCDNMSLQCCSFPNTNWVLGFSIFHSVYSTYTIHDSLSEINDKVVIFIDIITQNILYCFQWGFITLVEAKLWKPFIIKILSRRTYVTASRIDARKVCSYNKQWLLYCCGHPSKCLQHWPCPIFSSFILNPAT